MNYNLNHFAAALSLFKQAKDISAINNNPYYSADLDYKIGMTYIQMDSTNIAEKYFTNGIKTAKDADDFITESSNIEGLIQLLINSGKLTDAKKYIERLNYISLKNNWDYLSSVKNLLEGEINKIEGNFNQAEQCFTRSLKFADAANDFILKD